jgi:hypothetical protein
MLDVIWEALPLIAVLAILVLLATRDRMRRKNG